MLVAVAAPLYARGSAEHLLDQRTLEAENPTTGLNVESDPSGVGTSDGEAPKPLTGSERLAMLDRVTRLMESPAAGSFWKPTTRYLLSDGRYPVGLVSHPMHAYWREGMCDEVRIEGRCPSAPDEALIDPLMMQTIGEEIGGTVTITFDATVADPDGGQSLEAFPVTYKIVGTYTVDDEADPIWFDPSRTQGDGTLRPPSGRAPPSPAPALLVDRSGITFAGSSVAGADRPIDMQKVDIATMGAAREQLVQWQSEVAGEELPILQNDVVASLDGLFDDVRAEQTLLSRVTLAAIVPLVVLSLLLLYVLIAAAAEVRRQEVALAKLRGFSTSRVIRFAVAEPVAVLLVAVPLGAALAVLVARTVTGVWLGQTPFVITPQAVTAGVVVSVAALSAALIAVLGVVREPLAESLASSTRRRSVSRWAVLAQGAMVMLMVAAVAQIVTSDANRSSSLVELLAPLFVALGTAVLAMLCIGRLARLWMSRTRDRGGLSPFLAARRLGRRQDLGQLVLPLLLATAMATFAASAWKVADDWRVSRAAATVGADTVYRTETSPARLLWVTRQADPDGRFLMAAVPPIARGADGGRVALVDATRFARVAAWDDSWGAGGPAGVQAALLGEGRPDPVRFSGDSLTADLTDIDLRGGLNMPAELWVRYTSDRIGEQRLARLGQLPTKGDVTLTGSLAECDQGCSLEQVFVSGSSASVTDVKGTVTIARMAANGEPGEWRLDDASAWRPARPYGAEGGAPVSLDSDSGLRLTIDASSPAVVRITTSDVTAEPAMVATDETKLARDGDTVLGASIIGTRTPMHLDGRTVALPLVGNEGGVSDLETALREYGDLAGAVTPTYLLVAEGTPASVLDEVRGLGVDLSQSSSEADELEALRSDAFSLGWRVFLLVGVLTLLLAFVGVVALAVVQMRWRAYEVAALRVVGVRRKDLRRAILTEYVALLGLAVLGGALAALTSLVLVLPSLDIGAPDVFDPAVDYGLRWPVIGAVLVVVLVVVLAIAHWIAGRTVKLGTPATLRQADVR